MSVYTMTADEVREDDEVFTEWAWSDYAGEMEEAATAWEDIEVAQLYWAECCAAA